MRFPSPRAASGRSTGTPSEAMAGNVVDDAEGVGVASPWPPRGTSGHPPPAAPRAPRQLALRDSLASLASRMSRPQSCMIRSCSASISPSKSAVVAVGAGVLLLCFQDAESSMSPAPPMPAPPVFSAAGGGSLHCTQKSSSCLAQCQRQPLSEPLQSEHVNSEYLARRVHSIGQPPRPQRKTPWPPGGRARARSSCDGRVSVLLTLGMLSLTSAFSSIGDVSSIAPESVATKRAAVDGGGVASATACLRVTFWINSRSLRAASGVGAVCTVHWAHISLSHCWQPKTTSPGRCIRSHSSQKAQLHPMT
mmetsp:Transcript_109688/g.310295  ORF Transcript_109688/g.310295 Transcript_109688/m.310295 type:complete len:307 (+) Transcript_109688:576-1496(+)